jgi:hypothetical protein
MAQANLVFNPLFCVVEDSIVAVDVLGGVVIHVVSQGVGSDCVTWEEYNIYWCSFPLFRTVHKEVELGEEVDLWARSSSV